MQENLFEQQKTYFIDVSKNIVIGRNGTKWYTNTMKVCFEFFSKHPDGFLIIENPCGNDILEKIHLAKLWCKSDFLKFFRGNLFQKINKHLTWCELKNYKNDSVFWNLKRLSEHINSRRTLRTHDLNPLKNKYKTRIKRVTPHDLDL